MGGETAIRILVVDDERVVRDFLVKFFSLKDAQVRAVPDGPQALRLLEQEPFDFLIAEVNMTAMDGITILRRALAVRPHLKGILTSGSYIDESLKERCRSAGALALIHKPFDLQELICLYERQVSPQSQKECRGDA